MNEIHVVPENKYPFYRDSIEEFTIYVKKDDGQVYTYKTRVNLRKLIAEYVLSIFFRAAGTGQFPEDNVPRGQILAVLDKDGANLAMTPEKFVDFEPRDVTTEFNLAGVWPSDSAGDIHLFRLEQS